MRRSRPQATLTRVVSVLLVTTTLGLLSAPTLASRPVPVVVLPFADEGPARALSDGLELELQLSEVLLLSSSRGLREELGEAPTGQLALEGPERMADALALAGQQALLFGIVEGSEVAVALLRTHDAALIWATRVPLERADAELPALAARALAALLELDERWPLPDEQLVAFGLKSAPTQAAGPPSDAPREETEPADKGLSSSTNPPVDDDSATSAPALVLPAGLDRIGRATLRYAPSFRYYRACQPADPSRYVPFLCDAKEGTPPLEVLASPLEAPLGGALHVELYPLALVGLELSAALSTATLRATRQEGADVERLSPNPFRSVGGELTSALVLRLPFGSPVVGGAAGLRGGYHLAWAVSDEVTLDTGPRQVPFPLLPSYFSHHALVGAGLKVGLGPLVRLSLEVDALFGPHLEGPVVVGKDAFAIGARAHLGLDVELASGFLISATLESGGVSAGSSGTAPGEHRYTLALEPFEGGQVVNADARFGIGVGYRY